MNVYAESIKNEFWRSSDFVIMAGLVILGILFGLDIATTQFILSNGGYEMNILMQSVVSSGLFHIAVKLLVLSLIGGVVIYSNSKLKNSGTKVLFAIIVWYMIVAVHNISSIAGII